MYLVIEIQKDGEQLAPLVSAYGAQNEAESRFHQILAAAAVSSVPVHAAALLSEEGFLLCSGCYKHESAAE